MRASQLAVITALALIVAAMLAAAIWIRLVAGLPKDRSGKSGESAGKKRRDEILLAAQPIDSALHLRARELLLVGA